MTGPAAISRRAAVAGLAAAAVPGVGARAAPVLTDAMLAAANTEATVVFHTSIEVGLCEHMIAAFNARHPGIRVQLERTGAERILQRINQEYASNIYAADVVESSDTGMFVDWKRRGWLAAYVPDDVAASWPADERDPDGRYAAVRASLSVMGYNTKQVKPDEAPKGFLDLLQPKWRMRLVKAHPSYSGSIYTATYLTVQALGWEFMEKLAKQRVMQTQSATEPPKKIALGERSVMVDGSEYVLLAMQDSGSPVMPIYAVEGSPIFSGMCAVMERAAHPNAARVFQSFLFSQPCQQVMSDAGCLRSFHPGVNEKEGRMPLDRIKLLRADPEQLAAAAEDVKRRYAMVFGV